MESTISSDNKIILMYITARQFKNAIGIDEMMIIPARKNNLAENTIIKFADIFSATARGDELINKMFPFIVNKAFACEVYLKILLEIENIKIPTQHNLYSLFQLVDTNSKILSIMTKDVGIQESILNKIKDISNVFVEWRYIYEYANQKKTVEYSFLNSFTDWLDAYTSKKIYETYNYDVTKDCR